MPLINEIITLECFNSGRFNQLFQFSGIDLTDATAQMVSGGGNVGSESYQSLLISFASGDGSIKLMPQIPTSIPSFPYYGWKLEVLYSPNASDPYRLQYQFATEANMFLQGDHLFPWVGASYAVDRSGGGGSAGTTQSWSQNTGYAQILMGCAGIPYDPTPSGVTNPWLRVTISGEMRPRVCGGCGWQCLDRGGAATPREHKCIPGSEENECYYVDGVRPPEIDPYCWGWESSHDTEEECRENCCDSPPCTPGGRTMPTTKTAGPGTELANMLKAWGIHPKKSGGCKCKDMEVKMNRLGIACKEPKNLKMIVDHLQAEAKKRSLPFVRKVGEMLVLRAVKKFEQNS